MSFIHRVADRTSNRCASLVVVMSASCCRAEMSSTIQMLRPCVPSTRSLSRGCTTTSSTRTVGRPLMNFFHSRPPLSETKKPYSVHAYSRLRLRGSPSTQLTLPSGRFDEIDVHDLP